MRTRRAKSSNGIPIRAVSPNMGIRNEYRKKLLELIRPMLIEATAEIKRLYASDSPLIIQDETPASKYKAMIEDMRKRSRARFDKASEVLATGFTLKVVSNVARSQKSALSAAGLGDFAVRYDFGNVKRDVVDAIINQNVNLIKSIDQTFFEHLENEVMNAVTAGSDLQALAKSIRKLNQSTNRRAIMIAEDQINKATESIARANDIDAGFTKAQWIHIAGRYTSRPTHVAMNHKVFDLKKGMYDSAVGKYIQTGELVNCKCKYRPLFDFEVLKMGIK